MIAYLHNGRWYLFGYRIRIPKWFAKRISKYGYYTDERENFIWVFGKSSKKKDGNNNRANKLLTNDKCADVSVK